MKSIRERLYRNCIQLTLNRLEAENNHHCLLVVHENEHIQSYAEEHDFYNVYGTQAMITNAIISPLKGLLIVSADNLRDAVFFDEFISKCIEINPKHATIFICKMHLSIRTTETN